MSNQARWSVLQSYTLLKWHKHAHRAAVKALESGGSLSVVIRSIEKAISPISMQAYCPEVGFITQMMILIGITVEEPMSQSG
ncbi:hypothetical protein CFP56_039600 [Quercus suber]|uniref:Uncharacterized protein n=1 Tax=Quercus suber TaxID=58331 RepID=A0AAW0IZH2_QUESU